MMRQKKRPEKVRKRTQKRVRADQKCFWLICVALSLMVVLTGCENSDKALVFSSESMLEGTDAVQSGQSTQLENGAMWQQTPSEAGDNLEADTIRTPQLIYVHVCGAVLIPGVVEVPIGSRAEDALEAAGGFSDNADREYVNLASPVEDGQQLYFPTLEEAEHWREGMSVSRSGQIVVQSTGGLININTADKALLCTLPGIGEARAQAIIAYRAQQGPFEKTEDIMKVAGIKQSAFDKISTQITVE